MGWVGGSVVCGGVVYSLLCACSMLVNAFPPSPAQISSFVILLCLTPNDFTHQERERERELLGGKGLTGPIAHLSSLTLSTLDRPLVILLCPTPDDFTHQERATGWERIEVPKLHKLIY